MINKIFGQYRGLNKDIYILFIGRIVTALGSFIWPLMTLILSAKFHYDSSTIAILMIIGAFLNVPATYIGGKWADKSSRKKIILISNYTMVVGYLINAFLPLGIHTILIFYISTFFGNLQGPAYHALIADKSDSKDREKAFSLSYLGWNLGFILGPSIGGFLFENHLGLAFLIDGITTFLGTLLVMIYVQEKRSTDTEIKLNTYEQVETTGNAWQIIKESKVLMFYLVVMSLYGLMYMQSNFILPLQLQTLTPDFAKFYGLIYSMNGLIVIVFTPILSYLLTYKSEIFKMGLAIVFLIASFVLYAYFNTWLSFFVVGMFIFTLGEIAFTISGSAYFTRRIPATHRARVNAFMDMCNYTIVGLGQLSFGLLLKVISFQSAWLGVIGIGFFVLTLMPKFSRIDRTLYPLLYEGIDGH